MNVQKKRGDVLHQSVFYFSIDFGVISSPLKKHQTHQKIRFLKWLNSNLQGEILHTTSPVWWIKYVS